MDAGGEATSDAGAVDGGTPPRRGLHPEQIRRVMIGNLGAFRCCHEVALARDRHVEGEVRLAFGIGTDGVVREASVSSSSLADSEMEACMLDVLRGLRFASAEKGTNAVFPFLFRGKR